MKEKNSKRKREKGRKEREKTKSEGKFKRKWRGTEGKDMERSKWEWIIYI